jgi:hypothetical protein
MPVHLAFVCLERHMFRGLFISFSFCPRLTGDERRRPRRLLSIPFTIYIFKVNYTFLEQIGLSKYYSQLMLRGKHESHGCLPVKVNPPTLHKFPESQTTSTVMSAPNTPTTETEQPLPGAVFPHRQATPEQVRDWIRAWHEAHHIQIEENILKLVTWDGEWIYEQPPAQLESEIFAWGVSQGRGRMMVLNLVRERRKETEGRSVRSILWRKLHADREADFDHRSHGGMVLVAIRLCMW